MVRSLAGLVAVFLSLMVLAPLSAQQDQQRGDRQQRRGGEGFRGGPGFGGGMFGGGQGGGRMLMGLVMQEPVQKEVELNDEQLRQIREFAEQQQNERPQFDRERGQDLSQEERERRFAQMRERGEQADQQVQAKLTEVLLPHQMERLEQISIQVRGAQALADAKIATELKLSDEQKQKVASIQEGARDKYREAFQGGDRENFRQRIDTVRSGIDQELLAVLTDEQKQQFEQLKGEAFSMPEGAGFGGFGRGGPGERGDRPRRQADDQN